MYYVLAIVMIISPALAGEKYYLQPDGSVKRQAPAKPVCNCGGTKVMCSCGDKCDCSVKPTASVSYASILARVQAGESLFMSVDQDSPGSVRCDEALGLAMGDGTKIARGVYWCELVRTQRCGGGKCWFEMVAKMQRIEVPESMNKSK